RLGAVPPGKRHDAGGEVLAQRRFGRVLAVAALVERLARRVEIEHRLLRVEVAVDAHVGRARIDVRSAAPVGAEAVAHGVLDAQGREVEALQRRAGRIHVDAYRLPLAEPLGPRQREGGVVDVLLAPVRRGAEPQQHPRREARPEVGRVARGEVAAERDAARHGAGVERAERHELVDEQRFQPARAGREQIEALAHPAAYFARMRTARSSGSTASRTLSRRSRSRPGLSRKPRTAASAPASRWPPRKADSHSFTKKILRERLSSGSARSAGSTSAAVSSACSGAFWAPSAASIQLSGSAASRSARSKYRDLTAASRRAAPAAYA